MATSTNDTSVASIRRHLTLLRDKQNYEKWSEDMEIELERHNCWSIIDGSIAEPSLTRVPTQTDSEYATALSEFHLTNPAHRAWKQTNAQARWTIYFNCEKAIQKSINKKVNASEIWTYLKDQFGSQADIAWWSTARSLMNHTLAGSKDCTDFASKIRRDWTALESEGADILEWLACGQLIYHLGDTYQHFVVNELSKTPLKDQRLERLCGALFAKEARLQEQSQGLFAANATRSRDTTRGIRNSSSSSSTNKAVCQRCKDKGRENVNHKNEKCWFNKKDNYANMPSHLRKKLLEQIGKDQDSKKENSKNEGKSYGIVARSKPTTSLAMAASGSSSFSAQETYFNTCSENHIVGSIDLLHNVRPITMQLEWGEGHLIKVEGIGTRTLQTAVGDATNTLTIADVYYVPGFINILSYMRMRDKGMLFEDDGKQPRLRFKDEDDTVAYVNMPAKGEKGLPSLLLRTSRTYVTVR
jgi:hypothetical protein